MTLTPPDILAHSDVVEFLSWPFDFEMDPATIDSRADFTIAGIRGFEIIAGDGSGNRFVLPGSPDDPTRPLLFVDHECFAGVIGATLAEGVQVIVTLPYWRDLLKFSGGGDLDEMRRARDIFEGEFEDEILELEKDFDLAAARARIQSALALPPLHDPVASLHASVTRFERRFETTFIGGDACDSLFGPSRYRADQDLDGEEA
jgi:hypothetical protein